MEPFVPLRREAGDQRFGPKRLKLVGSRRGRALNQIFWKHEFARCPDLLQRLEFLARLKAHRFAGRNGDLRARARIAADARLSGFHGEDAETAKFNAVTLFERTLHFSKDSFHGHFSLGFRDSRLVDDFVYDVKLDQGVPQFGTERRNPDKPMIVLELFQCQGITTRDAQEDHGKSLVGGRFSD